MKTLNLNDVKVSRRWYVIDASNCILGRLASVVVKYLMGKHKVEYSSNVDVGDFIIILNINKIRITGCKYYFKKYYKHSSFPGGLKTITYQRFHTLCPEKVFYKTIRGMLPKNKLVKSFLSKLFVYVGYKHPHIAQSPCSLII